MRDTIKIIKENRKNGSSSDTDLLNFALEQLEMFYSLETQKENEKVSEGINNLSYMNQWANLLNIAKHAIDESLKAIEKEEHLKKHMLEIVGFYKFILESGKNDFIKYLTEEGKEKFFKGSSPLERLSWSIIRKEKG